MRLLVGKLLETKRLGRSTITDVATTSKTLPPPRRTKSRSLPRAQKVGVRHSPARPASDCRLAKIEWSAFPEP
jgi:hypothetical protein